MGRTPPDIWVCGNCRSVNIARAKQCYNCRTSRELAAVDPSQLEDLAPVQFALTAMRRTSPDVDTATANTATASPATTPTVTTTTPTRAPLEPPPAPTGPHLVVTIEADGSLVAEFGGESETVTLDSLRVAGEALYRAKGSASIRVVAPGEDVRAVARETFAVLSHAGVPTRVEP